MSDKARPLQPAEANVLKMIYLFNDLAEKGQQFANVTMSEGALQALVKGAIAKPFRVTPTKEATYAVIFTMVEYERYIHAVASFVGFTILMNGGVKTKDGLYVEPLAGADGKGKKSC